MERKLIKLSDVENNYFLDFKNWAENYLNQYEWMQFRKLMYKVGADKFNNYIENYKKQIRKADEAFNELVKETEETYKSYETYDGDTPAESYYIRTLDMINVLFYEWKKKLDSQLK